LLNNQACNFFLFFKRVLTSVIQKGCHERGRAKEVCCNKAGLAAGINGLAVKAVDKTIGKQKKTTVWRKKMK
jgi:hypothetical protein